MLIVLCFSVKDSGSERVWEGVVGQLKETMKIFNQLLGHCNSSAYLISFPESNSHQNLFQTADFLPSDWQCVTPDPIMLLFTPSSGHGCQWPSHHNCPHQILSSCKSTLPGVPPLCILLQDGHPKCCFGAVPYIIVNQFHGDIAWENFLLDGGDSRGDICGGGGGCGTGKDVCSAMVVTRLCFKDEMEESWCWHLW